MSTKNAFSFERDSRNTYVNFKDPLKYMPGFGNYHVSEALPHALPESQNAPQKCNYGLYAEQLQGTSFTAPRTENQKRFFLCFIGIATNLHFLAGSIVFYLLLSILITKNTRILQPN